jgi:spore maturation protein CgeB
MARACTPIYNALDPDTHFPVAPQDRFAATLSFLGNRLPDREARVAEFFLDPAAALPAQAFLLGGSGWDHRALPSNVTHLGHVGTDDHNAFNCSPMAVLNISRDNMAATGFSPATRVFEAAGAGACLITDHWEGIDMFFAPDKEVLVVRDGADVTDLLAELTPERSRRIGEAALSRVLNDHTYAQRAKDAHGCFMRAAEARKGAAA